VVGNCGAIVAEVVSVSVTLLEAAVWGGARVRGRLRGGPSSLSDAGLGDFECRGDF
jgi:hypothetical protein